MALLDKLNYIALDDRKVDEGSLDNSIKDFIDSLFGGNALDIIKYKHPKLSKNLDDLAHFYDQLSLESSVDELGFKVAVSSCAHQLTNLEKKREELIQRQEQVEQMIDAKKKLTIKIEHLRRLQKKGNVIESLKSDVEEVKKEFNERYKKAKATEKVLNDLGYSSALSSESMKKLKQDIANVKTRIDDYEESTKLFEGIESEEDLKREINNLNEALKNYKDLFIKSEED